MKLLSDAAEYGLRAAVWLARHPGRTQKVREIAEGTRAPAGYLIKALQSMGRAGILSAQRGVQGGFTLARDPALLTVLDIINAIDPVERIVTCPLGHESHATALCPLHRHVDQVVGRIEDAFASVTVAELLHQAADPSSACTALTGDSRIPLTIGSG